ncbi:unnamed protein product [Heligmosomoides polygyrus]|uniref:Importin N-terminal domain-containing protein n=1 Tax=Heligmosomoides polygyrus TaxID=6339 RepID=A0A183GSC1_HELPZ|nr:unnamed protein product [Heligmosomoides polygyrus]
MVRLTQLQKQLAEAVLSVVKKSPEAKRPEEACLAFENLTQLWPIPQLAIPMARPQQRTFQGRCAAIASSDSSYED